eukprot:COSAG01_NODE_76_length_28332_cov_298.876992_5_plen_108_part_00
MHYLTPPFPRGTPEPLFCDRMGWQTWCSVGPCGEDHCHDAQIRQMADTLVAKDKSSGKSMKDLGYDWIVLDDCWHPHRDSNGSLVPFPRFFPNGMKPVRSTSAPCTY